MPDRTDLPSARVPKGPWPEAADDDRVYDHGAPWCTNAAGHPDPNGGYPNATLHVPPHECRTRSLTVDAVDGLAGQDGDLEVYAAIPYQFGELRSRADRTDPRVVLAFLDAATGTVRQASISRGDALRVALHLTAIVRSIDDPPDARRAAGGSRANMTP